MSNIWNWFGKSLKIVGKSLEIADFTNGAHQNQNKNKTRTKKNTSFS